MQQWVAVVVFLLRTIVRRAILDARSVESEERSAYGQDTDELHTGFDRAKIPSFENKKVETMIGSNAHKVDRPVEPDVG